VSLEWSRAKRPARGSNPLKRSAQFLRRLRVLPNSDRARLVGWTTANAAATLISYEPRVSVTPGDLERWFGDEAPVLYHPSFGRQGSGPRLRRDGEGDESIGSPYRADLRLEWEHLRDQDLSSVVTDALLHGWDDTLSAAVNKRFGLAVHRSTPNPMESALRSVTWLEITRFRTTDPTFSLEQKRRLALWLLRCGGGIERRLHEIPLGGNHLLTHAAGLLYIGRLLPGSSRTARWARRGEQLLHTEVLRQFHADGGTYEQSLPSLLARRGAGMRPPSARSRRGPSR
jgi:hypothetical protein